MVTVTFLGTGGAFSAGLRSNLAVMIEVSDFRMLVESGPTIMEQLAHAHLPVQDIERLFVSHSHGDHTLGFPMLALNRLTASTPLHVYAGLNTIARLKMLCELVYPDIIHRLDLRWHELSEQGPDQARLTPEVTLRTTVVPHPPGIPTLAARWDIAGHSITFTSDTVPCPATVELAHGSDLLIHEASFSAELEPQVEPAVHFHSTARQAGQIARQAGCSRLALVHLSPQIGEHPDVLVEEARANTDLRVIVPEDGERVHV